jgi:hypothetical protein
LCARQEHTSGNDRTEKGNFSRVRTKRSTALREFEDFRKRLKYTLADPRECIRKKSGKTRFFISVFWVERCTQAHTTTFQFILPTTSSNASMAPTLLDITRKTYPEQAKWFLNAFWKSGAEQEAEAVWNYATKFIELDHEKKKNGNELDEFWSHK